MYLEVEQPRSCLAAAAGFRSTESRGGLQPIYPSLRLIIFSLTNLLCGQRMDWVKRSSAISNMSENASMTEPIKSNSSGFHLQSLEGF